jgi:hypothetical protein
MTGDIDAATDPHAIEFFDVIQKSSQRCEPAGAAEEAAMHPDRHHLGCFVPFGVQHIKGIPQIGKEMLRRVEPLRRCEPHVIRIEGVGYHQVPPRVAVCCFNFRPEWQVVSVVVSIVQKAALLDHQAASIWAVAAGVPTTRRLSGQPLNYFTGNSQVLPLSCFVDLLVVNPAPAVPGNFVPQFYECRRYFTGCVRGP